MMENQIEKLHLESLWKPPYMISKQPKKYLIFNIFPIQVILWKPFQNNVQLNLSNFSRRRSEHRF